MPQDPLLFYGSLNNLAMGAPYADDASILAAANLAGVSEFANLHPNGFDMLIGERGESCPAASASRWRGPRPDQRPAHPAAR